MKTAMTKPTATTSSPHLADTSRWLNVFQYCRMLNILGNVMVVLVLGLVSLFYVAVVCFTYAPVVLSASKHLLAALGALLVCILYTGVTGMVVWSYMAAVLTDPGRVPPGWHPFADEQHARVELERLMYSNYYQDRRDPRRPRYCKHCQCWKPERSHHCRVNGRCVLRMDHYCIWLVNCVGLLNYKAFLLFLFYAMLGCLLATLLLIQPTVDMFSNKMNSFRGPLVFVVLIVGGAFSLSVAGFLVMHGQLLAANHTTIEMYEKDRCHPWPYNKGLRRNFEDTFGRNKLRWLLPLHSKEERRHMLEASLGAAWVHAALQASSSSSGGATASTSSSSLGTASSTARLLPHAVSSSV